MKSSGRVWAIALLLLVVLAVVVLSYIFRGPTATVTTSGGPTPTLGPRTVFVHLFEWKWTDIAQECESWLGPKGYSAVQVSPPQEHIVAPNNPWWERYQPVSYKLESRSGTRAEFADMVGRCKAVGVDIYADAVINHMSGMESGTGIAGTTFSHYSYPGLYEYDDFHHCGLSGRSDDIYSYRNKLEVQTCELLNLADLDTGSSKVQGLIAAYLNDLLSLGVTGFRIDASKHIDASELKVILGKTNDRTTGDRPYIYQEVIEGAGEPITPSEYFQNGDVTEFKYSTRLGPNFRDGKLANLENFAMTGAFMPSDIAIIFTDNHDNQRAQGGPAVTFKEGPVYTLANVFMLGWPYGYPQVMSSYNFASSDQGPPANPDGSTLPVYANGAAACSDEGWICEHRRPEISGMVGFRNFTAPHFSISDWWTNGNNAIAFGRGDLGFVIINREDSELNNTFQTSMSPGTYCDVTKGELSVDGRGCTGPTVTVGEGGQLTATLPAMSALAIHGGARIGGR